MNVTENRKIYLGIAVFLVLLSWILILVLGLRPGIDLEGGTNWQVRFTDEAVDQEQVGSVLSKATSEMDVLVKKTGEGSFIIRLSDIGEEEHQLYAATLRGELGEMTEENFSSVGPTIGAELRQQSVTAMILVLLGISLYVAWAFRRVSQKVRSWKYGAVTLLTLIHDVSIPAGLLAFLGWWQGIEINTSFIVALLVVMGFSVHDTIVVFDRIRENLSTGRSSSLKEVINQSVRETLIRSLNTSLTLVFVLVTLILFGPPSLFYFILTILVGTVVGTYSSIFVASPILYLWGRRVARE